MEKLSVNNVGPTVRQVVLARHALDISQSTLAKKSGISVATIRRIETHESHELVSLFLRPKIYQVLMNFFIAEGVEFVTENDEKRGVLYLEKSQK
jgi:predicted transcriptional regulator